MLDELSMGFVQFVGLSLSVGKAVEFIGNKGDNQNDGHSDQNFDGTIGGFLFGDLVGVDLDIPFRNFRQGGDFVLLQGSWLMALH